MSSKKPYTACWDLIARSLVPRLRVGETVTQSMRGPRKSLGTWLNSACSLHAKVAKTHILRIYRHLPTVMQALRRYPRELAEVHL